LDTFKEMSFWYFVCKFKEPFYLGQVLMSFIKFICKQNIIFFYQKVMKQQFYKNNKTCKNIFELFFILRNHKLMQNAFFFLDLAMLQILEIVNKNAL